MTGRTLTALPMLLAVLALSSARAEPAARDAATLLGRLRCEVVDRLRRIHATPDPADEQNRFLILAQADAPGRYVQCVFTELDSKVYCEAASGVWLDAPGTPRTMILPAPAVAALRRLGFSGDGTAENYALTLDLGSPPDLDRAAVLMLTALTVGYDTPARATITFEAPDAPGPAGARCAPVG